ncbi:MAG: potassium channel family protein [Marinobacter sp.]|nr:potassium channel family protein [Marinobacter sp.]
MPEIVLINSLLVVVVVFIHYEFLFRLGQRLSHIGPQFHRSRIILAVLGALVAHAIEVWVFAGGYYLLHHAEAWGHLTGNFSGSLMDCAYFSFTVFTTLGFGDVEPFGAIRYLAGIEALTGLMLITWSASFLFIEMQRYWPTR